jgi:hypothetical protein
MILRVLAVWALLFAAAPSRAALVEIPGFPGWKIEAPDGFSQKSGSDCKGGERLCFTKGKAILSVNPVDVQVARCGWANEGIMTKVNEGVTFERGACDAAFGNGNKGYRVMIENGKFMELSYKFNIAATDLDNQAAQQAYDDIKVTLQPPPPPPKPEKPKKAGSKKEEAAAAAAAAIAAKSAIVPDTNGWHFKIPEGFEAAEPDLYRYARFKRTEGGVDAWIEFQFAGSPDELCAHGGDRVGERYESIRWDRHSFRSACLDEFGKAWNGRQMTAHSSEFLLEVEADRFIRTRLHYLDAELRSVDDEKVPQKLKEKAELSFERTWRSLAPKGVEVDLDSQ